MDVSVTGGELVSRNLLYLEVEFINNSTNHHLPPP